MCVCACVCVRVCACVCVSVMSLLIILACTVMSIDFVMSSYHVPSTAQFPQEAATSGASPPQALVPPSFLAASLPVPGQGPQCSMDRQPCFVLTLACYVSWIQTKHEGLDACLYVLNPNKAWKKSRWDMILSVEWIILKFSNKTGKGEKNIPQKPSPSASPLPPAKGSLRIHGSIFWGINVPTKSHISNNPYTIFGVDDVGLIPSNFYTASQIPLVSIQVSGCSFKNCPWPPCADLFELQHCHQNIPTPRNFNMEP